MRFHTLFTRLAALHSQGCHSRTKCSLRAPFYVSNACMLTLSFIEKDFKIRLG